MPTFHELFGKTPTISADAPGRVNLIGEHTDYNGGFVLPTAIPQRCHVELAIRTDDIVRVWSAAHAGEGVAQYTLGGEIAGGGWLDFIQGVTRLLSQRGDRLSGFDAFIDSRVPLGSGLSSSAALTVSLMRALRTAYALDLDDVTIAILGQRVENEFVGARVGIMDPMAASLADGGTALFLDARSLDYERVPLPVDTDLIVIHSGISHRLTHGDYNTRRSECEQAAEMLGVRELRDLTPDDWPRINTLPEPLNRRVRHVFTENARVWQAVKAMHDGDLGALGELFYDSHRSMRDDYEVSIPEIDLLIELARDDADIVGARLTGGGFGGSVVMFAHAGRGSTAAQRLAAISAERTGQQPRVLVPET